MPPPVTTRGPSTSGLATRGRRNATTRATLSPFPAYGGNYAAMLAVLLCAMSAPAMGSHFRYGTLSYRPLAETYNPADQTQQVRRITSNRNRNANPRRYNGVLSNEYIETKERTITEV